MSRTIHGSSFKTLALFRKKSAALEVYWVYVARANNESVAWPSARQLGTDTGWNKDTCLRARKWLVEHGALERVEKYVQPKWRKLESAAVQNLINLDRAEYYRPTGTITIDGEVHPLLYTPVGNEGEDVSKNEPVVRPRRTTTPPDIRPRRIELDSTPILDSNKDSASTPQAPPEPKKQRQRDPVFDMVAEKWFGVQRDTAAFAAIGGRIGKHVKWLKGNAIKVKRDGATVNIPGLQGWMNPADLVQALRDWKHDNDNLTPPQDILKFVEYIDGWQRVAVAPYAPEIEPLTAEQLAEDTARQFGVGL